MKKELKDAIEDSPIIAAIKDDSGLEKCLSSETSQIIFVLYGDIITIPKIVEKIKAEGKLVFVHVDLIQGLQSKEIAVDYIKEYTKADGIISTKAPLIARAKELNLYTIMRFFVIDSMALSSIEKQMKNTRPDIIEILPALMPSVIKKIAALAKVPIIAGGLIADKEDVMATLNAGATSISSTNEDVWFL